MSGPSAIEWTDATWNPFRGCVKVSPGCKHCYAETFAERFRRVAGHPYERGFEPRFVPEALSWPLRWRKARRIFVNSMSDLFLEAFSDDEIDRVFAVMAICEMHSMRSGHIFQVLTKRSRRMRDYLSAPVGELRARLGRIAGQMMEDGDRWADSITHRMPWPLPNVWLGVSAENQEYADARIPNLLASPARVRFVSYEPALGPVHFARYLPDDGNAGMLDWIIVGGESGHGARVFDPGWARNVIRQCDAAGVPVFVKQMGSRPVESVIWDTGGILTFLRRKDGRPLSHKGGVPAEWPKDLRVRQFPV